MKALICKPRRGVKRERIVRGPRFIEWLHKAWEDAAFLGLLENLEFRRELSFVWQQAAKEAITPELHATFELTLDPTKTPQK